jgi:hypothetical protein
MHVMWCGLDPLMSFLNSLQLDVTNACHVAIKVFLVNNAYSILMLPFWSISNNQCCWQRQKAKNLSYKPAIAAYGAAVVGNASQICVPSSRVFIRNDIHSLETLTTQVISHTCWWIHSFLFYWDTSQLFAWPLYIVKGW